MTGTDGNAMGKSNTDHEPGDVEALLPWHAAGTLNPRDASRVEQALARDPELARQYAVIQEEQAETIHLNESLGAPSVRAMQKLFAAIDTEPARRTRVSISPLLRIGQFFTSLTPRTLAWSAIAGALALLLQAGIIGTVLMKDHATSQFQTASSGTHVEGGAMALVGFKPDARLADITAFLDSYDASIVSGPQGGMFRIRFGGKDLSQQQIAQLIARIQHEKVVGFAAATD